jgi:hypothetical protein
MQLCAFWCCCMCVCPLSLHARAARFQMLVSVFREVIPKDGPLKNFYLIVPALTISYVESFKNAKEALAHQSQKVRRGAG